MNSTYLYSAYSGIKYQRMKNKFLALMILDYSSSWICNDQHDAYNRNCLDYWAILKNAQLL